MSLAIKPSQNTSNLNCKKLHLSFPKDNERKSGFSNTHWTANNNKYNLGKTLFWIKVIFAEKVCIFLHEMNNS